MRWASSADGPSSTGAGGENLLRIIVTAEVDGVRRDHVITSGRYGANVAVGRAYARSDAPGGREADAEQLAAVIEALTGKEPKVLVYIAAADLLRLAEGDGEIRRAMALYLAERAKDGNRGGGRSPKRS